MMQPDMLSYPVRAGVDVLATIHFAVETSPDGTSICMKVNVVGVGGS
jgi:hypothetical protein